MDSAVARDGYAAPASLRGSEKLRGFKRRPENSTVTVR